MTLLLLPVCVLPRYVDYALLKTHKEHVVLDLHAIAFESVDVALAHVEEDFIQLLVSLGALGVLVYPFNVGVHAV